MTTADLTGGMHGTGSPRDRRTLVILGATGDLTARLLLPGLAGLVATGDAPPLSLVGAGTDDWDDERWRARVRESFAAAGAPGDAATAVAEHARYLRADVTRQDDLRKLLGACSGQVAIFFALPPAVTARACAGLGGIRLPSGTRLVLEKPFGTDARTCRASTSCSTRTSRSRGARVTTTAPGR